MRGSNKGHPGSLRQFPCPHTFAVDGNGDDMGSSGAQNLARALVAGIFDCDTVSAFDENAGDQIERLLRAVDYQHLRRFTYHGARAPKVSADCFTQGKVAARRTVVELRDGSPTGATHQGPPPFLERKCLQVAETVGKVINQTGVLASRKVDPRPCAGCGLPKS